MKRKTYLFEGEEKNLLEWSLDDRCNVDYTTLAKRISHYKWDFEKALLTPVETKDLTGKIFGKLFVVRDTGRTKRRQKIWDCLCSCLKKIEVPTGQLKTGQTRSCGCLRKDNINKRYKLPTGQASSNSVLYGYQKSAKIRNYEWKLSKEEFLNLTSGNCFYCGDAPSLISQRSKTFNGPYIHNGIDRLDNNLGYTIDNTVSCCKKCNYAKRTMSLDEFKNHITKIYTNLCKSSTQ